MIRKIEIERLFCLQSCREIVSTASLPNRTVQENNPSVAPDGSLLLLASNVNMDVSFLFLTKISFLFLLLCLICIDYEFRLYNSLS